jgi:hypothetical protein
MIFVEILSRHRDVAARFRFADQDVYIGRGYDNDVIVDDPYVGARHARLFRDDAGRLVVEDMGSANGMFLDRDKSRRRRIIVDGERPIRIGHTHLRIRETSHGVGPERIARSGVRIAPIALAAALCLVITGIEIVTRWSGETGEPRVSNYLAPLLWLAVIVPAWVAVWALLSRTFSGSAHVQRNLLIALAGILGFALCSELAQFSGFALNWAFVANYHYVAMWIILAIVCFLHLREVSRSRLVLKGAVVLILFAFIVTVQTLQQLEAFYNSGRETVSRRLLPPALRLVPVRDEHAFFAEIEGLKAKLDRDRLRARTDEAAP